ncbi:SsrA-binding protein SmpB [Flexithrix dorotheae]|uniref:SsrA-binding protein SmpB n=1 Tax=Flexithrix dorotheae TaxID=70993 RepID=UPI0003A939D3|nr:SsrA-binding protein SmpB [Flexithrix dorotheae]
MAKKPDIQKTVNIKNKQASHEYHFIDKFLAGIMLKGSEIKSIRMGKVNLRDSFCTFFNNELWVRNMDISPYLMGGYANHSAKADRKLLLTKKELKKLEEKLKDVGLTIVPTRLFINDRGLAKMEIALAKGKKLYDKRQDLKEKDLKREMDRIR